MISHDGFVRSISGGKIEGKKGKERPRRSYLDQIMEKKMSCSIRKSKFRRS